MTTATAPAHPPITPAELQQAADAYASAKAAHPELTSYGFGLPRVSSYVPTDAWADGLTEQHLQEIARASRWLQGIPTVSRATARNVGSYSAKHQAERWAGGYVREGALIVAALAAGVPIKPYSQGRGHGAYLGLSRRAINEDHAC